MGGSVYDGGGVGGGFFISCGRFWWDSNCEVWVVCKCLLLVFVGGKGGSGMFGGGEGLGRDFVIRGRGMLFLWFCWLVWLGIIENMLVFFVICWGGGGVWRFILLLKGFMGRGVRVLWIVDSCCFKVFWWLGSLNFLWGCSVVMFVNWCGWGFILNGLEVFWGNKFECFVVSGCLDGFGNVNEFCFDVVIGLSVKVWFVFLFLCLVVGCFEIFLWVDGWFIIIESGCIVLRGGGVLCVIGWGGGVSGVIYFGRVFM